MHIWIFFCNFARGIVIITNKLFNYMKKILLFLVLGCTLMGCRSKIDLGNIDAKAGFDDVGLALPIGKFRMTLKDMVGDVDNIYIEKGIVTWKMDTPIVRDYHKVDLAKYLSSTPSISMKVYDKLDAEGLIGPDGKVTTLPGMPMKISLDFPLTIKLKGINNPDILSDERVDSAWIEHANFASTIQAIGGLPLDWNWIDTVTLDLGDRVRRSKEAGGNVMVVYAKGDKYGYGDSIPTDVNDFSLNMMKNTSLPPHYTNVIDSCNFNIRFTFTIPADTSFLVPATSAFDYRLSVRFIDYTAIWGMFSPSSDMQTEEKINLSDNWGSLDFLTKASLPFAAPSVDVDIRTYIAGALYIDSAYVFVTDSNNIPKYAEFGPNRQKTRQVLFKEGEYLPLSSQIGDSTTHMKVLFDSTAEGGRINELFQRVPKDLGYRFKVRFNQGLTPQIRVVPNTSIKVIAHSTLPFIFNEGVFVNYPDTFHNVNLSDVSLDSLQASSDVVDTISAANLKIVMQAKNNIPLHVKATMRCYDKDDKMIMDPKDPTKPFILFDSDTITIDPPTMAYDAKEESWRTTGEGITTFISTLSKEDINLLPSVKTISIRAIIDDKALKYAYDQGMESIRLLQNQDLIFKLGVTAKVSAVLDFNNDKK